MEISSRASNVTCCCEPSSATGREDVEEVRGQADGLLPAGRRPPPSLTTGREDVEEARGQADGLLPAGRSPLP